MSILRTGILTYMLLLIKVTCSNDSHGILIKSISRVNFLRGFEKNAQFSLSQRRKFYLLMNLLSWNLLYHLSHGRRFCLFSGYLLELLDFQIKIDCCYYFPLALIKSRSWHSNLRDTISGMTFNNLILIVVNVSIARSQFSSQNEFTWLT